MRVAIHKDGIPGTVKFNVDRGEIMVSHPDEEVRNTVRRYLTTERTFTIPGKHVGQKWMEDHTPTDHPMYLDMALCEMFHRTGVHVDWSHHDNEGWRYPGDDNTEDESVVKSIDGDGEYQIIKL